MKLSSYWSADSHVRELSSRSGFARTWLSALLSLLVRGPNARAKRKAAFHELDRADLPVRPIKFMVPMRPRKSVGAHEPPSRSCRCEAAGLFVAENGRAFTGAATEKGSAILVVLILLVLMSIIVISNCLVLRHLKEELRLIEHRQKQQLEAGARRLKTPHPASSLSPTNAAPRLVPAEP